jgi:hypothetical protein
LQKIDDCHAVIGRNEDFFGHCMRFASF